MRVAVVGAGVGGLVTAASLALEGVRCTVFERSGGPPEQPRGAAVQQRESR